MAVPGKRQKRGQTLFFLILAVAARRQNGAAGIPARDARRFANFVIAARPRLAYREREHKHERRNSPFR
jgi:hypothetical protein